MSIHLLDVNVLIALAWPNHIHHARSLDWFSANRDTGWATCPLIQTAFVRVSSNPAATIEAKSPAEAILQLERIIALPDHVFWTDDISLAASPEVARDRILGHRQVTDAHLIALAIRNDGRLATFDRGVPGLVGGGREPAEIVTLIEP